MPTQRDNPYANHNFAVDIGAGENVWFSAVDLPAGKIEVIEYREGGDKSSTARKLPGRVEYPNVTLKRGLSGRMELFEWWRAIRDGSLERRDVAITLHDAQHTPVQRWLLRNAWPTKLEYGPLNALGNEVAIETLELAHEGFEVD